MRSIQWAMQLLVVSLLFGIVAFAQTDIPTNGACFYRDTGFRGSYFCVQAGQTLQNVPSGFNDTIRSVRIYGNTQVTVFNANLLGGESTTLSSDVTDLRALPLAADASRNWSERISSLKADAIGDAQGRGWGYKWGQRQRGGKSGACFFEQPNFRGQSFCVDQGSELDNLPSGFNDRIQSIQIVGGSEVQVFNDPNFTGVAARTSRDVADLRSWRIPDDASRNWGGRISSLRVDSPRRGRWNNIGGYDRTRGDESQNLVSCTARTSGSRQVCSSPGYVRDASMINSSGTCRKNVSWGIDNGRLWVSNGCSADFEVQP